MFDIYHVMIYTYEMTWTINFTRKAAKQSNKLPQNILAVLQLLIEDTKLHGPRPAEGWSNYSRLKGVKNSDKRHCHLKKGNPTYVCCWEVVNKQIRIIEVYYVGTHEKAPY